MHVTGSRGARLYYEDWGRGRPILFLHGRGMSHEVWQNQVHALQDEYRLITLDLRGHGDSEKVAGPYSHDAYAADIRSVILRLKLRNLCLVGWSTGSFVILRYAQKYGLAPHVKAIALIGTASNFKRGDNLEGSDGLAKYLKPLEKNFTEALRKFLNEMLYNPRKPIVDWLFQISLKTPLTVLLQTLSANLEGDYESILERIDVPALILQGKHDAFTPLAGARYMASRMRNARLVTFSRSGHPPHLEEPGKFNFELRRFLRDNL